MRLSQFDEAAIYQPHLARFCALDQPAIVRGNENGRS
jgi:hypothetical protein